MEIKNFQNLEISARKNILEYVTMLLTDGYVSQNKNTWEIGFVNSSSTLRQRFEILTKKLFNKKCSKKRSQAGVQTLRFYSKRAAEQLLGICGTFRTKKYEDGSFPQISFPENLNDAEIIAVLQMAFSTDGAIIFSIRKFGNKTRVEPRLKLSCKNPSLSEIFSDLLKKMKIGHYLGKECILIRKTSEILKFSKVGFLDGVKIGGDSKKFTNYPKQHLFDISCYLIRNKKLFFC